jgi:hypothetical protein
MTESHEEWAKRLMEEEGLLREQEVSQSRIGH